MQKSANEFEFDARLDSSLASERPLQAVMAVVLEFSGGALNCTQVKESLLEKHREAQQDEDRWQDEAVLGDVLDLIEGFFVPDAKNQDLSFFAEYFRNLKTE